MSEVISTEPTTSRPVLHPGSETSVEVFAVYGVEPEIQAYAMAKYSRSALSMKESLKEITLAEGGKVSQHLLLPVRAPLHRRPGAHRAGHRAALDPGRHRRCRRAALGRTGALHSLPGLQEERLLHARVFRTTRGCRATLRPPRLSIAKPSSPCSRLTKKFRSGRSNISPASRPGPPK